MCVRVRVRVCLSCLYSIILVRAVRVKANLKKRLVFSFDSS